MSSDGLIILGRSDGSTVGADDGAFVEEPVVDGRGACTMMVVGSQSSLELALLVAEVGATEGVVAGVVRAGLVVVVGN